MNMTGINPAVGGGPVGGNMMMMNNATGSPAMQTNSSSAETTKLLLNTYIYEYFLKVGLYDIARALVKEEKFDIRTYPKQSPGRRKDGEVNGADGDAMDMDGKDDIPDDLPRPSHIGDSGQQSSGFLFEWFAVFTDIYQAHRGQGKIQGQLTPATQYLLQHQHIQRMRESQQNQRSGMPNQFAAMRAGQMRQNGMVNGDAARKLTPQQLQLAQSKAMQQQQQMQRDAHADGDPSARPGTPADGENGGSPSKRPRLGEQPFNGSMMPNGGRPGVPGVPQQNMMIQAGFTPNMNQAAAQFRQNGAMPPKNMAGVGNGMIGMTSSGSPMMQAMSQFPEGIPGDIYNNARAMGQGMPGVPNGQSGNHALQDYQMQLMLLEQQNKKRLMMARQEQHENTNPRDGQPIPGGVNMPPGVSPSGSRTGTSPNPTEQMKRNPQLGGVAGSPSADMQGRSPVNMAYMNGMQQQDFANAMFMKDNQQMMGGPGGPNMRPPVVDINALNRQQQGRMGNQFQQGGQPMTQQPSQGQPQPVGTPGQRNEMPPPSAPPAGNSAQRNNQPASPATSNAPPTPSQTSKPNPKAKKGKEETNKKRPQKKNSTANAPNAEDPPATPTPSTPMTPVHPNSFNNSTGKGGPNVAQGNQQHQQNQVMPPNQQQMQQPDVGQNNQYPDFAAPDPGFNLDFSTLENADVLENFDFDTFLNTSADDAFNFDGNMSVEGFAMDAPGE